MHHMHLFITAVLNKPTRITHSKYSRKQQTVQTQLATRGMTSKGRCIHTRVGVLHCSTNSLHQTDVTSMC
jgi:hypothetical protein